MPRAPEPGDIWLGDLLRCVVRLGPLDEDQKTALARQLGLAWSAPRRQVGDEPEAPVPPTATSTGDEAGPPSQPVPAAPQATSRGAEARATSRPRLAPVARVARTAPWESREPLADYLPELHGLPLRHEPLWERRWTRQLIATVLSRPSVSRTIDVRRAIDIIAAARPLTEVPRLPGRAVARGAQVLMDTSGSMAPYARDRAPLAQQVERTAGRSTTAVMRFTRTPLRGVKARGERTWQPYSPPEPGAPVIALTDLRIGRAAVDSRLEDQADWLEFARRLKARGSRVVALVPYASRRWPPTLTGAMTIVHWDRSTTVTDVLEQITQAERR